MAKKKEQMVYWKTGARGEKHDIPLGATVVFKAPNGDSVEVKFDGDGILVLER